MNTKDLKGKTVKLKWFKGQFVVTDAAEDIGENLFIIDYHGSPLVCDTFQIKKVLE